MTEKREIIIEVRNRGHDMRVERVQRLAAGVTNRYETVYDGFIDDRKTQDAKPVEAIMRWLGNALEDGS